MDLDILYQDAQIILCVKPAGVLSEEGGMPELLRAQTASTQIYCVHRLDRAVGGLMVYAKTKEAAASLSGQIAEGHLEKRYLAVCRGDAPQQGEMRDLLYHDAKTNKSYVVKRMRKGVREAVLRYERLERQGDLSLVRVGLLTGRSHQIRVQFASRQLPLLGDRRYGGGEGEIALWSSELRFLHPQSGDELYFRAAPPQKEPWTHFTTI
jgi:23S rRNA pseudouridine1911/1915/1917 synthase